MKKILISLGIFALLILSTTTFAQTTNTEPVSCFDHYKFGSVYASLETKNFKNTSGTTINFFGEVKNDNKYPIVDGKLFVKVMRANPSYGKTGGQDEVDSFVVKEGISIPANSSVPINFDWKIPAHSISGKYQVSTYFLVDNSFNMSGLPFTTDIVGGTVKFDVVGEQKEGLIFDRINITLNDGIYYTVAFPPIISATSTANVVFTLSNATNQTQRVPVTLELYEWDSQAQKNLLDTKETTYLIDANSSITIPYTVVDTNHSVYYVLAKAQYKDAKSEVAVRFGRADKQEPRINFSTFTQYPFVKGEENSLITCVHNTSKGDAEYGKVVTSVLDHKGNVIHTSTYEGKITGAIQGLLSKFTPSANYKDLTINTKIYNKDNSVIDETSVDYVCSDLSKDCKEPNLFFNITTLITTLAVLILVALLITFRNRLKKKDLIVMFMFVMLSGVLLVPRVGEASSWIVWSSDTPVIATGVAGDPVDWSVLWALATPCDDSISWCGDTDNINFNVDYHIKINKHDTQELITNTSIVQEGDKLDFIFGPFSWMDITWLRYGETLGTPYGDWTLNAENTLDSEFRKIINSTNTYTFLAVENLIKPFDEKFRFDSSGEWWWSGGHNQMSVKIPNVQLVYNTSDLVCDPIEKIDAVNSFYFKQICTVKPTTSTKTVSPIFKFPQTLFSFYSAYIGFNVPSSASSQCKDLWDSSSQDNCPVTNVRIVPLSEYVDLTNLTIDEVNITRSFTVQPATACTPLNTPVKPTISVSPDSIYVNDTATLSFSPSNANTTYEIDWGDTAGWQATTNPVDKPWSTPGTKSVKVKATDITSLCSIESDPTSVTVLDSPTLNSITDLWTTGSCGSVSLSWTGNGADSYKIFRKTSSTNFTEIVSTVSGSYTDSGVTNNTVYTYKVVAIKSGYADVESNSSSATPGCLSCDTTQHTENEVIDSGGVCTQYNCDTSTGNWIAGTIACPLVLVDATISFYFNPNTVSSGEFCSLYLTAENVGACELRNRLGTVSVAADLLPRTPDYNISILGTVDVPIGAHTLYCSATSAPTVFLPFNTQKCFSESNVKEN